MKNWNLNFIIEGENQSGNFKIKPEELIIVTGVGKLVEKRIVVGLVLEGEVEKGNKIMMKFPNGSVLQDQIKSLEVNKQVVPYVARNEHFGMLLTNTRLRDIRRLNS